MKRPIGGMILGVLAALAGLWQIYLMLIFAGIVKFTFLGQEVGFGTIQWGQFLWSGLMMLIWFWVAAGFFTARLYAWMFGIMISGITLIWSMFAVLGSATLESMFPSLALSVIVLFYLMYPGTREAFYESEVAQAKR
jgi:hypothetical protein